ncbi:hypothetical protein PSU4_19220 [Pseudonocardia sulfidoxydans NBRC 16205]|uniref:Uncharacterized protein n=1 Tax=Pseudonocardia sulfidoxydans NBRC 16205 TaxID=1223511 RepID=A0A511DIW5_9PSEU|nr:hypothetical protein PSU4_19220 [Pseudonocardia sulfidoxydans NBRC 16205]
MDGAGRLLLVGVDLARCIVVDSAAGVVLLDLAEIVWLRAPSRGRKNGRRRMGCVDLPPRAPESDRPVDWIEHRAVCVGAAGSAEKGDVPRIHVKHPPCR